MTRLFEHAERVLDSTWKHSRDVECQIEAKDTF